MHSYLRVSLPPKNKIYFPKILNVFYGEFKKNFRFGKIFDFPSFVEYGKGIQPPPIFGTMTEFQGTNARIDWLAI